MFLLDKSLTIDLSRKNVLEYLLSLFEILNEADMNFQNWVSEQSIVNQNNINKNGRYKLYHRFYTNLFLQEEYLTINKILGFPQEFISRVNEIDTLVLLKTKNEQKFTNEKIDEGIMILSNFKKEYDLKDSIYIFGGYAEKRKHKDLDVLIETERDYSIFYKVDLMEKIISQYDLLFDLFFFNTEEVINLTKFNFFSNKKLIS